MQRVEAGDGAGVVVEARAEFGEELEDDVLEPEAGHVARRVAVGRGRQRRGGAAGRDRTGRDRTGRDRTAALLVRGLRLPRRKPEDRPAVVEHRRVVEEEACRRRAAQCSYKLCPTPREILRLLARGRLRNRPFAESAVCGIASNGR